MEGTRMSLLAPDLRQVHDRLHRLHMHRSPGNRMLAGGKITGSRWNARRDEQSRSGNFRSLVLYIIYSTLWLWGDKVAPWHPCIYSFLWDFWVGLSAGGILSIQRSVRIAKLFAV